MRNWKDILLIVVILSIGCVRIDMPEIVFSKPKTYTIKRMSGFS
jgi:hypothetical protein